VYSVQLLDGGNQGGKGGSNPYGSPAVEPPVAPFQILLMYKNRRGKNTQDVFWYIWPTILAKPKLQSATKKKPYPTNSSCPSSAVSCHPNPTQSPQSSLCRPKPPNPIYCSTLTVSCCLRLSSEPVPPAGEKPARRRRGDC
jgi:hypothetical protein